MNNKKMTAYSIIMHQQRQTTSVGGTQLSMTEERQQRAAVFEQRIHAHAAMRKLQAAGPSVAHSSYPSTMSQTAGWASSCYNEHLRQQVCCDAYQAVAGGPNLLEPCSSRGNKGIDLPTETQDGLHAATFTMLMHAIMLVCVLQIHN
jgi:hypothetical protein